MAHRLGLDDAALADFCARHHIQRLSLFGSTLKGTNRPDSDIDLLVEFAPGSTPALFNLVEMEQELSGLLGGRQVALRTARDLSCYFRDEVVRTSGNNNRGQCGLAMPRTLAGGKPARVIASHEAGIEPCSRIGNDAIDA
jgi:predicted nucleotidyltransferase